MKVVSLASITCDHEAEMLILAMYLKIFENVKYFRSIQIQILLIPELQIQLLILYKRF